MAELVDQPRNVRAGEELDGPKLEAYLKSKVPGLEGSMRVAQFPGGASNLTYSVAFDNADFVLRRPPFGKKPKSGHDMKREATVMQRLHPHYPTPEVVLFCDDPEVMGCDFFVMRRIRGIIFRKDLPKELAFGPEQARQLGYSVIDQLVRLHQLDYQAIGLADLGHPEGYVKRQVEGWIGRYEAARTPDAADFRSVMDWLRAKMPPESGASIVHNDFRIDNCIMDPAEPTKVIGVLDWEMATLGDPLMDLGNTLTYWIEAGDPPPFQMVRAQPTHLPGMPTRDEIVRYYAEKTGRTIDSFEWYLAWGCFRLAVILQQIYYRYFHGQTKDERFRSFVHFGALLEQAALGYVKRAGG